MKAMKTSKPAVDLKGVMILIILCASWGFNQVAIKVAIEGISPVLQAGLRSMGSAALLMLWMRFKNIPIFNKDGSFWWGIAAGTLFSAEFILIYWGLEFTSASRSAIFLNTAPFGVALGAHLFIPKEKLRPLQVIGLCLAFGGILAVFNDSMGLPDSIALLGDVMILAAALLWASVTVMIKASPLAHISPGKVLLYQLLVSAMFLPVASVILGEPGIKDLSAMVGLSMVYQIVWVAFITYLAWFWLISNYPVSKIAPFTFLSPLFGVISGVMILNEPMTPLLILALLLVGTGIYLVNK